MTAIPQTHSFPSGGVGAISLDRMNVYINPRLTKVVSETSAMSNNSTSAMPEIVKHAPKNTSVNRAASDSAARELTASTRPECQPNTTSKPVDLTLENIPSANNRMSLIALGAIIFFIEKVRLIICRTTYYYQTN